jgi:hypothetical protein
MNKNISVKITEILCQIRSLLAFEFCEKYIYVRVCFLHSTNFHASVKRQDLEGGFNEPASLVTKHDSINPLKQEFNLNKV